MMLPKSSATPPAIGSASFRSEPSLARMPAGAKARKRVITGIAAPVDTTLAKPRNTTPPSRSPEDAPQRTSLRPPDFPSPVVRMVLNMK